MSLRRSFGFLALGVGALAVAGPAPAVVTINFNTTTTGTYTTTGSGNATAAIFKSTETVDGNKLNVRVTGWHAVDQTGAGANPNIDSVQAATLGIYDGGLGVTATGDNGGANNLHQIDNLDGVDFVMLQFNKAVLLTGIGRTVFSLPNINPSDSDASVWGDTASLVGTPANYASAINLAAYTVDESVWTRVDGTTSTVSTSPALAASLWLVAADFTATPGFRNDGFKLSSLKVTYTAPPISTVGAVPEPATWGMMILGFAAVGVAARRRRAGQGRVVAD